MLETKTAAVKSASVTKRASRSSIVDKMVNSKGKFITVSFTKQDGTVRTMNCKVRKENNITQLGYIMVTETKTNTIKNVDPRTLIYAKISSVTYKVRN